MLTWRGNYTDESQVKSLCTLTMNICRKRTCENTYKMDGPTKTEARLPASARPGWSARTLHKVPLSLCVLMI